MISSLELAKICGVSQGTVDRALHGRAEISEATRRKILEAAKAHGYTPNPAARELMTGRSAHCGAVIPAGGSIFFMDLLEKLRKALRKRGLSLYLAPASNADESAAAIRELAARRARGIAIIPPSDSFIVPPEAARQRIVSLASPCKGAIYIAPDETQTGFNGAQYLWSIGHRRIAFATYARKARAIQERKEGYKRFMLSADAKPEILVQPDAKDFLQFIKTKHPSAILCHNDWLALNCLRAMETAGVAVPGEISIMGVDDSPTFNALSPGLSSMSYPYAEVAEAAAAIMAGEQEAPSKIPPLKLKPRNSAAPFQK